MPERFAGRYELLRPLGHGGMGEVHLARDVDLKVEVALKRLSTRVHVAPETLRREFEILTRVRHPSVVEVHELDFAPDGEPFYTMEYVPGLPADEAHLEHDVARLAFVAAETAHGLEALHALGVYHGDLKPSNLLVVPGADPKAMPASVRLVDFGLAMVREHADRNPRGTPGFVPLEVLAGASIDARSDLYGLGALLYAIAAGRPAFAGKTHEEVLERQRAGPPSLAPLEDNGVPPAFARLILRLMATDPVERPREAADVRREIEELYPATRRPLVERLHAARVVGRDRELGRFEGWLAEPVARGRMLLISGPAGVGKTALLGQFASRANLAGRKVVHLSCGSTSVPGSIARVILRRWLATLDGGSRPAVLPDGVRAMAADDAPELAPDALERLVAGAVAIGRAAEGRLPIQILDDAERLDPLSKAFVVRVMMHPSPPPALWVLARRGSVGDLLDEDFALIAADACDSVQLKPLNEIHTARLVSARLGQPAPEPLFEFVWARAKGHPGFTVQLLHAAANAGAILDGDAGLIASADYLDRLPLPDFQASLLARHAALSPQARGVANALAVWGRPLESARALKLADAAVTGVRNEDVELLVHAGLVDCDRDNVLSLLPPALDAPLRERIDPAERRALHRAALGSPGLSIGERFRHLRDAGEPDAALAAAAGALESQADPELAARAATLAEQRSPADAAQWHERHARMLMASGRYAAAITALERSLEIDPGAALRHSRRAALCTALLRAGDPDRLRRALVDALDKDSPSGESRALLLTARAISVADHDGNPQEGHRIAIEALSEAELTADPRTIGIAAQTLASVLNRLGLKEGAEHAAAQALASFEAADDRMGIVRALLAQAWLARGPDGAPSHGLLDRALRRARAENLRLGIEETLEARVAFRVEDGRWEEARTDLAEQIRIALEDGRARGAALALTNLALIDGLVGDASQAMRRAQRARRLCEVARPSALPSTARAMAQAHRLAGRLTLAEKWARTAIRDAIRLSQPREADWGRIELARTWIARHQWARVAAMAARVVGPSAKTTSIETRILVALAGRAELRAENIGASHVALARAEAGRPAPYAAAMVGLLRAEIAIVEGRVNHAIDAAREALETLHGLPAAGERAQATLEMARLARGKGLLEALPFGPWLDDAAQTLALHGNSRAREQALELQTHGLRRAAITVAGPANDRELIEQVSGLLNSMSSLEDMARSAMKMIVQRLEPEVGLVLLWDPKAEDFARLAEHGPIDARTRDEAAHYSRRVVQRVTSSGASLLLADASAEPVALSESVVELGLRSILCVPMFVSGRVVGAVYLADSRRRDAFATERQLLEGFAQLIALAFERSLSYRELAEQNESLVTRSLEARNAAPALGAPNGLVIASQAMRRVMSHVELAARVNSTVLLTGENGTGKARIAEDLHRQSKRAGLFVVVNCGAIPENLLESELYGIRSHIATGVHAREGRFQLADKGTLLLDEIGDMPMHQQVALLNVLDSRQVTPVGGGKPIHVDVRLIAATNRDLSRKIAEGKFREDLYYRLNVIPIHVPALREHKADIPHLAEHFLRELSASQSRQRPKLSDDFVATLMRSDWPGNVRELHNYMERLIAMSPGPVLHPSPPPDDLDEGDASPRRVGGQSLPDLVDDLERRMVRDALERSRGNQSAAAKELGMTEQSIRYRIRKYGFDHRQLRRHR